MAARGFSPALRGWRFAFAMRVPNGFWNRDPRHIRFQSLWVLGEMGSGATHFRSASHLE